MLERMDPSVCISKGVIHFHKHVQSFWLAKKKHFVLNKTGFSELWCVSGIAHIKI